MKSSKFQARVVLAVLGALVTSIPAHASLGDLAVLLRSPLGRFIMLETEQGAAITLHALGAGATQAGESNMDALIARLGSDEMSETAHNLESRLRTARSRFRAQAALTTFGAEDLLGRLASESLTSRLGAAGQLEFISMDLVNLQMEREAFMRMDKPNRLAAADMSSHRFEPHFKFEDADMRFADLEASVAEYGHFDGAMMEHVNLREAQLRGSDFYGAELRSADLSGAKLKDASFRNAHLRDANLSGANLMDVDFRGADLRGTNMSGAAVGQVGFRTTTTMNLRGALIDSHTQLPSGMTIERARELGATIMGS